MYGKKKEHNSDGGTFKKFRTITSETMPSVETKPAPDVPDSAPRRGKPKVSC